jgi:hypothetical protein
MKLPNKSIFCSQIVAVLLAFAVNTSSDAATFTTTGSYKICQSDVPGSDALAKESPSASQEEPVLRPGGNARCDWVPREIMKPAAGQCGFMDNGAPAPGIFRCGDKVLDDKCVAACEFVRCHDL